MPKFICPAGTDGYLDALACLVYKLSKPTIKTIQPPDVIKSCSRNILISITLFDEGKAICREAIIVMVLEDMKGLALIVNDQAPVDEYLELFLVGLWRLEMVHPLPPQKKSNPPI